MEGWPIKNHDVNVTWSPPRNEAFTLITYIVILARTFFKSTMLRSCFVRFKFKTSLKREIPANNIKHQVFFYGFFSMH